MKYGEKKLEGKITLLLNHDGIKIEIVDALSGIRVAKIKLDKDQMCAALSRTARTDCEVEYTERPDRIGKKMSVFTEYEDVPGHLQDHDELSQMAIVKAKRKYLGQDASFECGGLQGSFTRPNDKTTRGKVLVRVWEKVPAEKEPEKEEESAFPNISPVHGTSPKTPRKRKGKSKK